MAIVPLRGSRDSDERRDKAVRLFTFLREVTALRNSPVRDLDRYEEVLWLDAIPDAPECFSLWRLPPGTDAEYWIQIRKPNLPPPPRTAELLAGWLNPLDVANSQLDVPPLADRLILPSEDGQPQSTGLPDNPSVTPAYEDYVERLWWPWASLDRKLQPILDVYTKLFTIYRRQQQLGEQYELVLGLGYLTWVIGAEHPTRVRRHLIVAQSDVTFDAERGIVSVGPGSDGARLTLEQDMLDPEHRVSGHALDHITATLDGREALHDGATILAAMRTWVNAASPSGI
ncbi:MAG TPA: hypothetical protein VMW47_13410, partial [Verrucomicrobiae bacterium]|nr:hypothetical protein [Verrucomicrobiae bacterium]